MRKIIFAFLATCGSWSNAGAIGSGGPPMGYAAMCWKDSATPMIQLAVTNRAGNGQYSVDAEGPFGSINILPVQFTYGATTQTNNFLGSGFSLSVQVGMVAPDGTCPGHLDYQPANGTLYSADVLCACE